MLAANEIADEVARVRGTGGWIYDGRVCNILAVSRAFGDWEFKVCGCDICSMKKREGRFQGSNNLIG